MSNQEKYSKFRSQYAYLRYEGHQITKSEEGIRVRYRFDLSGELTFTPSFLIPPQEYQFEIDETNIGFELIVFHIGLIELISYWKAACPPKIIIAPYKLESYQVDWLKKVYFKGLSEFFYLNKIDATQADFVEIESEGGQYIPIHSFDYLKEKEWSLIPVGGGKDSAVTCEIFSKIEVPNKKTICFLLNPRPSCEKVCAAAGHPTFVIKRFLDKKLLELNAKGYLNGHTPFSALLSFYSILVSALLGTRNIVLSNESSANEATIPGTEVNHQYSKTIEYERDLRAYTDRYFQQAFNYFSFLRPINELQIAGLLAQYPKYHSIFRSCNKGSKMDSWCAKCSKCLFTYIMLAPFLPTEKLVEIYGADLLDDKDLEGIFWQLTGHAPEKPFECVGTIDEVNYALYLTIKNRPNKKLPYLLERYQQKAAKSIDKGLLTEFVTENFVPTHFEVMLRNEINNLQVHQG